jgi:hypothetical protein
MLVRLTKKLANVINGLDISQCAEGDVIDLPQRDADMLVAEQWAEPATLDEVSSCTPVWQPNRRAVAADRGRGRSDDDGPDVAP